MDPFYAALLGFIQGCTEFLPVSSTGHLILATSLFGIPESDFVKSFTIAIQAGTILSVIVLYWKRLFSSPEILKRVGTAFLPTAVVGFILYKLVKNFLIGNLIVTTASLFVGGIILIVFELTHRQKDTDIDDMARITYRQAVMIGLFQAIAVIPGVSRSGATIIGGMCLNIRRRTIVEFSFLLAVPTLMAATALDLAKSSYNFTQDQWLCIAIGSVVSFTVAILSIKFFLSFVKQFTLVAFGFYRILISVFFWYLV